MPPFPPSATRVVVRRALAQILDYASLWPIWFVLGVPDRPVLGWVLFGIVTIAYFGAWQGASGWTVGKLVFGLRVVDDAGAAPGVYDGVRRAVPLLLETFAIVALWFMLRSPWRQRAGDRWANTYVVRRAALAR
jgi:uncharacterized RDD family membrane protein YckC